MGVYFRREPGDNTPGHHDHLRFMRMVIVTVNAITVTTLITKVTIVPPFRPK